jgi:hypothetical protein
VGPAELAEGRSNVFRAVAGQEFVRLVFEVDFDLSDFPIELEVVRTDGDVVFRESRIGRDRLVEPAYLFFDCATRDCVPGSYVAHIRAEGAPARPQEIPFEIRRE